LGILKALVGKAVPETGHLLERHYLLENLKVLVGKMALETARLLEWHYPLEQLEYHPVRQEGQHWPLMGPFRSPILHSGITGLLLRYLLVRIDRPCRGQ